MATKNLHGDNNIGRQQSHNANTTRRIMGLFIWISIYRLANAWMIRTQFDPDEYWQTLEPAYCLVFGSTDDGNIINDSTNEEYQNDQRIHGCALTWEWTRRWTPPSSTTTIQSTASESIRQNVQIMIEQALHGPVRSYVSILPTYWYYLSCRSLFHWADVSELAIDNNANNANRVTKYYTNFQSYLKQCIRHHSTYLISKGPALLHAILVAAPTDLSVWLIASRMNNLQSSPANKKYENESCYWKSWPFWALLCSITSWFHGYTLVRTYANSVETVCLLVGIALLGPELFGQSHSDLGSNPQRCHRPHAKLAFVLGGLSACVRFTSIAAWVPVGLIIAFRRGKVTSRDNTKLYKCRNALHTLIGLCATYGFIGVILGCFIDRWFYGFWAIPSLGNIHFNVLLGHGSLYGTHPFLWYFYAGIPAICGIMLPFFLWELAIIKKVASNGVWKPSTNMTSPSVSEKDNQEESEYNNPRVALLGIVAPYIVLHSFSEHKEFRFLLPILPLICILAGHAMARLALIIGEANDGSVDSSDGRSYKSPLKSMIGNNTSPKLLLVVLILLNYPHLFYLGIIHQRGPIAVNQFLASTIDKKAREVSQSNKVENPQENSIHFLMGCHSAPLYSHLHTPNAQVNAWYLDCSPNCRSNPEIVCESDAFSSDPLGFALSVYGSSGDDDCSEEDIKEPPSFLVVIQDDAVVIGNVLTDNLKMSHVASIRHTVKFLSWHRHNRYDVSSYDQCISHEKCHDVVTLFSLIDIHFDHMEVFYKSHPSL